jgi:Domain of unknown function (DUF5655)/Domain of unknown function (DUF4287)
MGKVEDALQSMRHNLADKTGKSLDAWVALTKKQKLAKHRQIVAWLKSEHALGHGYANIIASAVLATVESPKGNDDLLTAQYAGVKAALKPIYDSLAKMIASFGDDVEFSPKKTYVSLRRSKQFALIQASTATRIDVGINLKDAPAGARLGASGSFNAMVSHRVRLDNVQQVDSELRAWLKRAYDAA